LQIRDPRPDLLRAPAEEAALPGVGRRQNGITLAPRQKRSAMDGYFTLDERGNPSEEKDFATWARWFERADRSVARTLVTPEVTVLTTFSGVDHSTRGDPPRLFETRVFGGVLDAEETRHATKVEAIAAHATLAGWCRLGASADCGVTEQDAQR
jgi:hypothetical protein